MKKGEALFYVFIISGYVLLFLVMFVTQYTMFLESTEDPKLMLQSTQIKGALGAGAGFYFAFLVIYWVISYLQAFKVANSVERQNMKIKDTVNVKEFEGVGIIHHEPVTVSKIKADQIFLNRELNEMFKEIRSRLDRFYQKNVSQVVSDEEKIKKKLKDDEKQTKITFEIDNLRKQDVDFKSYELEYLLFRDLNSFFDEKEIEFLSNNGINDCDDLLDLDIKEIATLEDSFHFNTKRKRDLKEAQLKISNTLDILSSKEVEFFRSKGIRNVNDMMSQDLDMLSQEFNSHFDLEYKSPKPIGITKIFDAIKKIGKKTVNIDEPVDLHEVVDYITDEIIRRESKFIYTLSKDARFKYVYLKLVNMKALNYKYFSYLVEFDEPIEIEVGEPNYKPFVGEKNEIEGIVTNEQFVEIIKALIILPAPWEESFEYEHGTLYNFDGHSVKCSKMTDVEYVFKGMLDHEHAILFTISCSYIREHLRTQLQLNTDKILDKEKEALSHIVQKLVSRQETIDNILNMERSRLERVKLDNDTAFEKALEDLDVQEIQRNWTMTPTSPKNIRDYVIFIIGVVIGALVFGLIVYSIMQSRINILEALTYNNHSSNLIAVLNLFKNIDWGLKIVRFI